MALRSFHDSNGTTWQVWDVIPGAWYGDERRQRERRSEEPVLRYTGEERRRKTDRRRCSYERLVGSGYEHGWLTFESPQEKRRLAPIPAGWEAAPEEELARLWAEAAAADLHS